VATSLLDQALAALARPAPTLADAPLSEPPPERFTRRGLSLRPAPPDADQPTIALEDLPDLLMDETTRYLNIPDPGYALLLAAAPGAGKTRHAVQLAERVAAAGHRVLYAGPRRAFWRDVQAEQTRPDWWYAWQPRSTGDLETEPPIPLTCRWADQMTAWLGRGYEAMDFCSNPRICGWSYLNERCPWHAQKRRHEPIVFGQHAHVALGHPLMERFYLVIGDELPLAAFLHRWTIPLTQIVPPGVDDADLENLLRNLRWLCVNPPDDASGWEGASLYHALPGGPQAVQATLARYRASLSMLAYAPQLRTASQAEDAPYFHLLELARLMLRESDRAQRGQGVIPRVRCDATGLTLRLRRAPQQLPPHVVWLDATGDAGIYQALLDRPVQVVRPHVRMTGRVYQVWASANNRGAVLDDRPSADGQTTGAHKQTQIRAQIARIVAAHGYHCPGIISYKPLGDALLPGAPQAHFGAARGTNRLQEVDALFVVGAPLPTLHVLQEMAAMLFFERDEPFRAEWHARDIPFTGQAAAHSVGGFWDDGDLTTLLRQIRESEIVQAVHRARPLRRDVDVWLLTNVVTELPVALVSLHALFGALDALGQPLRGIDVLRWPEVLALPATPDAPLTTRRLMDVFGISRPTAGKWIDALIATGAYTRIDLPPEGDRRRPAVGLVKGFSDRISKASL
jgi:hypothetical protein